MHIINFYPKKIEEPLSMRVSACLEASYYYYYIYRYVLAKGGGLDALFFSLLPSKLWPSVENLRI